jgi:nucleotide-binding universal stress UspA family protein
MLANVKHILVAMMQGAAERKTSSALAYALSLAERAEARLTVQSASQELVFRGPFETDFAAGLVAAENARFKARAAKAAEDARAAAKLAGVICETDSPHLSYIDVVAAFVARARVHDVTVLDAEPIGALIDNGLVEAALFEIGRPLIVVPPAITEFRALRIAVAWDGGARAARALNDALPLLRAADRVEIVSVSGEKDLSRTVPGAEVAPHLTAHGVNATVVDLVAENGDVAEALRIYATKAAADMIVMGAFAHSLIRQTILGGVTRSLLGASATPLFLSY